VVAADCQLDRRTATGRGKRPVPEAFDVMDPDAITRLSRLHGTFSVGFRGNEKRRAREAQPLPVDFQTIHTDGRGRGDPEANAVPSDLAGPPCVGPMSSSERLRATSDATVLPGAAPCPRDSKSGNPIGRTAEERLAGNGRVSV